MTKITRDEYNEAAGNEYYEQIYTVGELNDFMSFDKKFQMVIDTVLGDCDDISNRDPYVTIGDDGSIYSLSELDDEKYENVDCAIPYQSYDSLKELVLMARGVSENNNLSLFQISQTLGPSSKTYFNNDDEYVIFNGYGKPEFAQNWEKLADPDIMEEIKEEKQVEKKHQNTFTP